MSDFIGSNLYYIVSPLDNELPIDLAGGNKADGTAVAVWCAVLSIPSPTPTDRLTLQEQECKQAQHAVALCLRWYW